MNYYTKSLLFERLWDWGSPPDFGAVRLGSVEIFFCLGDQGQPGTWLCIMVDDVDTYHAAVVQAGAEVIQPPTDRPWGVREMLVRDPNAHVIRFGHGIPRRGPKLEIERIGIAARLEKRLAAMAHDLAARKGMSLGEMLEEMLLHSFEPLPGGGVASPHDRRTLAQISELKNTHGIDYDCHASYRFVEKSGSPGP